MIPLVRHIDAGIGDAGASRFFRDKTDRTRRIVWRRQRVAALAAWGWLCSIAAIGTALVLPVTAFGTVVGTFLEALGLEALVDALGSLGPVVLGLALTVGLFYAVAKVGLGRWHDWDRRERRAMHPETPTLPDRSKAEAQAMALVGGLLSVVFAALGWAAAATIAFVLGAAAGLIIWARRPFAGDARPLRPPR